MYTNSELPFDMFDENFELNSMDFVLFHLAYSEANYYNYYRIIRERFPDRIMIFDNSAYEFYVHNKDFNEYTEQFVEMVRELQPDYFILPDVLMNKEETLKRSYDFAMKYGVVLGKSQAMAVVQGNTFEELTSCAEYLINTLDIRNICIPFHNRCFYEMSESADQDIKDYFGEMTEDVKYAVGRVMWVRANSELLHKCDYVHFLGSHCPKEKHFYTEYNSMDTGYPVKLGIEGVRLGEEKAKPNIIIDDFYDKKTPDDIKNIIRYNVIQFKNIE